MKKSNLWQLSQASMGIVQWIGLAIIVAPLILSRTNSALLVGQVMLILGLSGLTAPLLGSIADKYMLHKPMHLLALICHASALLLLLFVSTTQWHYWGIACLIGLGSNLLLILNPTLALRLNSSPKSQSNALKHLFQIQMLGVAVTGVTIACLDYLQLSVNIQLGTLFAFDLLLIVVTVLYPPKTQVFITEPHELNTNSDRSHSKVVWFGFVVCVLMSMFVGSNMVEMGPVIIDKGFGVNVSSSAFGMAIAALVTLVALTPAGTWMATHGAHSLWFITVIVNLIVGISIWFMFGHNIMALLPLSLILISIINGAWNDISIAALADEISPYRPATTQGFMAAAVSLGFSIGTYIVGVLLDHDKIANVVGFLALSGLVVAMLASWVLVKLPKTKTLPIEQQRFELKDKQC
ncbi:MFS transporter [Vibrio sp. La 4.2.2]|uniref:MFS transporter n=1 Tax=Vibrio sp. La 4.2.2 TaxID=2998830 RepID=UPI0022CE2950|nr:MFS transporter [Vibrio sp. La 4.2.2]MDA0108052.1 MFS transporter [Vibrio sp. La 4.2.2]